MNRTDGYTMDVSYPAFFYKEMQPVWLSTVTRFLGFSAPDVALPFSFCELGCGIGVNLLVAAACHPDGHFIGVDFNDQHLQIARDAARVCGIKNIEFIHCGFAEFAANNRIQFDFITTHGVWSWIAPEHQKALLHSATASLKPGGLFYLQYMCHPGSTDLIAIQHILNVFSHHIPGSSAQRVQTGLRLLRQLADRGLFLDKPDLLNHLGNLENKDLSHLAHEFLTDHWQPQHSTDVHWQVGEADLSYLGSADIFNNLDPSLSVPGNWQGVIRQTKIPPMAETLKDMARNSHQRMDLFQRKPQSYSSQHHIRQLSHLHFALLTDAPASSAISFTTPIGPIEGAAETLSPLLQSLASGVKSFADLAAIPAYAGQYGLLLQTIGLLMMQGIVHPAKPLPPSGNPQAEALNQWFARNHITLRIIDECGTALGGYAP